MSDPIDAELFRAMLNDPRARIEQLAFAASRESNRAGGRSAAIKALDAGRTGRVASGRRGGAARRRAEL